MIKLWVKNNQLETKYKTAFDEIMHNNYKMRFYNLIQTIKGWFK